MIIEELNMQTFFLQLSKPFCENEFNPKEIKISEKDLIHNKQCFYIFDLNKNKIIYHKGFDKLLGYQKEDINLEYILGNYHPNDKEIVNRIAQAVILHCLDKPFYCKDSTLQITYRIKRADNTYIKVLSQSSSYRMNKQGFMTHILVKLTDVSFLNSTFCVNWNFQAKDLDTFKKQIYKAYSDFFTTREKEIIILISKELTSKSIAKHLNVSEHTVATHRKNIFKKSGRHNVKDLIIFCKRKGII